jgi:hypothetical protein
MQANARNQLFDAGSIFLMTDDPFDFFQAGNPDSTNPESRGTLSL